MALAGGEYHSLGLKADPGEPGIVAANPPAQDSVAYATVSVTFGGAPWPAPSAANVAVACNGTGPAACPIVTSVSGSGAGPYTLTLSGPIPPRHCTTMTFAGTSAGQKVQYQSLPAGLNFSGSVSAADVQALVIALNNGQAAQAANLPRFSATGGSAAAETSTVRAA